MTITESESKVVQDQFRRNLDHILIGSGDIGPELTIGDTVLRFKSKAPVKALAALIGDDNRVQGMITYILGVLQPGQEEAFTTLLDSIDVEGLGEILEKLAEGYTSFPAQSPTG